MLTRFRRFAACLLMLVLPLQGIAAASGLRIMADCPMTGMQGDCCEHGKHDADSHAGHQDDSTQMAHGDDSCGMSAGCPMLGSLAVPAAAPQLAAFNPGADRVFSADSRFTSHIPDGLRRPPRHFS